MSADLIPQAIDQALAGKWKEAIATNLQILKRTPGDIESLNRLGRAYLETGQKTKASQVYAKVLRKDKFNTIAAKNLQLLKTLQVERKGSPSRSLAALPMFLEEPGITKTVSLVRLGDPKLVARLRPGDAVKLTARQHNVTLVSSTNAYLGRLPDDLALRLRTMMTAGNTYVAWIRSVEPHELKVFIKEIGRSPKYRHTPSFPLTEKLTYAAFTPPELVHEEKPDVSATEFQEDETPTPEEQAEEG